MQDIHEGSMDKTMKVLVIHNSAAEEDPAAVSIVIEGNQVLNTCGYPTKACVLLMGLIYAFNLEYPKKLKYTFEGPEPQNVPGVAAGALQRRLDVPLEEAGLQTTKSLGYSDVPYRIGELKVTEVVESEDIPIFLEIKAIYCVNGQWFVVGTKMVPSSFESHFHAFKVEEMGCLESWRGVGPSQLDIHSNMEGERYVALRYWVV
ncbi:hypothetical protein DPEC_G00096520 [Dallia pectoralis]|uniref:Uncharacterized protein n=1 Tax=Dallia pectoralis TaxID=75939 RepID=A0ACC2GVV9_DALPE|nr:hypothetical protein DPEC_G00096520 [Dallia pectoralis]